MWNQEWSSKDKCFCPDHLSKRRDKGIHRIKTNSSTSVPSKEKGQTGVYVSEKIIMYL